MDDKCSHYHKATTQDDDGMMISEQATYSAAQLGLIKTVLVIY